MDGPPIYLDLSEKRENVNCLYMLSDLSEFGVEQAENVAESLTKADLVICSELPRAKQTTSSLRGEKQGLKNRTCSPTRSQCCQFMSVHPFLSGTTEVIFLAFEWNTCRNILEPFVGRREKREARGGHRDSLSAYGT